MVLLITLSLLQVSTYSKLMRSFLCKCLSSAGSASQNPPAKSGMGNHGLPGKKVSVPSHSILVSLKVLQIIINFFFKKIAAMNSSALKTVQHQVGALDEVLATVKKAKLNLKKIESRPSKVLLYDGVYSWV